MKIYSDRKYLPAGFRQCHLLYPFWEYRPLPDSAPEFRPLFDNAELNVNRLKKYVERGRSIFELTELKDAQVAVLPFDWRLIEHSDLLSGNDSAIAPEPAHALMLAQEMAAAVASAAKPLCVFFSHDNDTRRIPLRNSFIFRRSLLRSRQQPNEFALPLWVGDEIEAAFNGDLPMRTKNSRPIVSFMGYDPLAGSEKGTKKSLLRSIAAALRAALTDAHRTHPFQARSAALDLLSRSSGLTCKFVIRRQWWNGTVLPRSMDSSLVQRSHREFVTNMINSDYVLCVRGQGNCSYRLYETLCNGRIPIFVNTDCVMPYDKWIDWTQYCVWVEERDLPRVADIVLDFHERISPRRFQELQKACRQLWLDWLSPQGFFSNFYRFFA